MNLLQIYEGAIENAENNDVDVNREYFEQYAEASLEIYLGNEELDMLEDYHSDQDAFRDFEKRQKMRDVVLSEENV